MASVLPELQPMLAAAKNGPAVDLTQEPAVLRATADAGVIAAGAFVRSPRAPVTVEEHHVASQDGAVPMRLYRPGPGTRGAHLHVHGGGWWMGSLETADALAREMAAATGLVVASVEYRLAPEHRFPTAVDDVLSALWWLHHQARHLGIDGASLSIGGESAGANLAAAVALLARERGPSLVGQWLDVPAVDLTLPETTSTAEFGTGFGLDLDEIRRVLDWYVSPADRRDPRASPALAGDLSGLPPTLLTVAECDPLRDQGEAYAALLQARGVPVTVIRSIGHLHGTTWLSALTDSGAAWHEQCSHVLRTFHAARAEELSA
ncbi:MAG: alpha/beta hydrolase [Actinomycetota bacterium]|nr:alpha/beta hydrolase [Actinomycetota bacterium]